MARIDLDDLPPRIAKVLAELSDGEEVMLVHNGGVVVRLTAQVSAPAAPQTEPPSDAEVAEIMDHFQSMIDDEF
jgi:antitoxin (DNA-binding transcriptional repressor) of toxin-antitoxin stability system